jgi:hypothetical protein
MLLSTVGSATKGRVAHPSRTCEGGVRECRIEIRVFHHSPNPDLPVDQIASVISPGVLPGRLKVAPYEVRGGVPNNGHSPEGDG